jgi:hypothetical protein
MYLSEKAIYQKREKISFFRKKSRNNFSKEKGCQHAREHSKNICKSDSQEYDTTLLNLIS